MSLFSKSYEHEIYELQCALYVLSNGGSVEKNSCYDEEGVDCWHWEFDDKEWTELGPHEDLPPIPDEMVKYIKLKFPHLHYGKS